MRISKYRLLAATGLATALMATPGFALAQSTPQGTTAGQGADQDATEVGEVVVTGIRAALRNALAGK